MIGNVKVVVGVQKASLFVLCVWPKHNWIILLSLKLLWIFKQQIMDVIWCFRSTWVKTSQVNCIYVAQHKISNHYIASQDLKYEAVCPKNLNSDTEKLHKKVRVLSSVLHSLCNGTTSLTRSKGYRFDYKSVSIQTIYIFAVDPVNYFTNLEK